MAIVKNRLKGEFFSSRDSMPISTDDDELRRHSSGSEHDNSGDDDEEDDNDDDDSGIASEDVDLSELGEVGEELCQVGKQLCSVPFELYDLPGLSEILSVDVWNECLSEEERFDLVKYLPDMDQEAFLRTMKELFLGENFHFGSPIVKLFDMLKGGLCEPRVLLYQHGWSCLERFKHCHLLREYQNSMVGKFVRVNNVWSSCKVYGIEERLRVLNLMRSQKGLLYDKREDVDSPGREDLGDGLWTKRLKDTAHGSGSPTVDASSRERGLLKVSSGETPMGSYPSDHRGFEPKYRPHGSSPVAGHDVGTADTLIGVPVSSRHGGLHTQRNNWNVNSMAEVTMKHDRGSLNYSPQEAGKNAKYLNKYPQASAEDNAYTAKTGARPQNQNYGYARRKEEEFALDHRANSRWDARSNELKMRPDFRTNRNNVSSYLKVENYESSPPHMHDMLGPSGYRSRKLDKKTNREFVQNGRDLEEFTQIDETESDSSEQADEEEDINLVRSKLGYPNKHLKKANPGAKYLSKARGDAPGEQLHLRDVEVYSLKGKQNAKFHDPRYLHNYSTGISDESGFSNFVNVAYKSTKIERMSLFKAQPSVKNKKGFVGQEYHVPHSNYARHYMDDTMKIDTMGRRVQTSEAHPTDCQERSNMHLLECSSTAKKRKGKVDGTYIRGRNEYENMYSSPQQQVNDASPMTKRGKREPEAESDSLAMLSSEKGSMDVDLETKPGKRPFTLITPSIHTDFSFSIIHLLSAVRVAMVTPLAEDASDVGKQMEQNGNQETVNANTSISEQIGATNIPSLTVQQIVNRVKSNPGDPCILETQEPLQDLVRGVLKIFSSKTAPLGAKGWKALVSYEKSTKSWSWIGPVSLSSSDPDTIEEVTSVDAWALPHKMIVKLVDSFATWLKNGQETLRQIGSLPPPPSALMQPNIDEKERFRDLRAQKSLTTITPSSEEVREYFRKEEMLRYLVPDRAFSYTAADGKKSIVAPLRRGGGKPTSKARDHPILKSDRPPHVTILCLVRDAASRLPGSIGTRADVCTLIRDSQYIVEDVTDAQVNQVVSGALDRLHYERDPCVQFDGERKLWVYLHRDREEEDFEDDGTSSTKKWKRPRKDAAEQADIAATNVAYHGAGEQVTGGSDIAYVANTDVKVEPSFTHAAQSVDLLYHGLRSNEDENTGPFVGSERGRLHLTGSTDWDVLNMNSMRENKMHCQENSTNEDYDDETFGRDRSVGRFGASIKKALHDIA